MNRKKLYAILAAESAFIIILCVLTVQVPDSFTSIWNFPFEQIGAGLLDANRDGGADGRLQCNAAYVFAIPFAHHDEPANTCFQHRVYAVCPAAYAHHR